MTPIAAEAIRPRHASDRAEARPRHASRSQAGDADAYDASFARVLDANGVDLVLVGDSLGMVVQGHDHACR